MAELSELDTQHLSAELARIDVLVRNQIELAVLAGQDFQDPIRGLHLADQQAKAVARRPIGTSWATQAHGPAEVIARHERDLAEAESNIRIIVARARNVGTKTRLMHIAAAFGLSRFELDAFLIALAPQLDVRFEQMYGFLNDDVTRKRATVNLVLDLLREPGIERLTHLFRFTESAPLQRFRLLVDGTDPATPPGTTPLLTKNLIPDSSIVLWILGNYVPGAGESNSEAYMRWRLLDGGAFVQVRPESWLTQLSALVTRDSATLVSFHGADSAAQLASSKALLGLVGRVGLIADLSSVFPHAQAEQAGVDGKDAEQSFAVRTVDPTVAEQHLRRALRDARMTGSVAIIDGWEACLNEGMMPPMLFQTLVDHPDTVILLSRSHWHVRGGYRERRVVRHDFGMPSYEQRRAMWKAAIGSEVTQGKMLDLLSGQFALTSAQIEDSVQAARDLSIERGGVEPESRDLFAAARMHVSPKLTLLARKIVPRHEWNDIVLPPDQISILKELVAMVRNRPTVLESWAVGKKLVPSSGVTTMFAGPPGTGKTMSAEVVAAQLELDLYKIDLSSMVSKYIGETEKNLEKIFREAERSNAILFFDEADAIFGKRGDVRDANDRYANIEVSYLLQRMEAYDGVTILATNLRSNLDEAFTRRLQFVVDFPFPDEQYRLILWRNLFPESVPHESIDFESLARRFKLSGGNIRNVIVAACYLAANEGPDGRVTSEHISHALRRELQKMGRLV